MNGAPTIEPIATSREPLLPPISAITGITDSGSAVATAARMLPTAPAPRSRRAPAHSTAFVKTTAPPRSAAKAPARIA
jgi:hypothetical protein